MHKTAAPSNTAKVGAQSRGIDPGFAASAARIIWTAMTSTTYVNACATAQTGPCNGTCTALYSTAPGHYATSGAPLWRWAPFPKDGTLPELEFTTGALIDADIQWDPENPRACAELSDVIRELVQWVDDRVSRGCELHTLTAESELPTLGYGHFGRCFDASRYFRGRGVVLKATAAPDDSYPIWIEWCSQNQYPGVPEVLAHGWAGHLFWVLLPKYVGVDVLTGDLPDDGWWETAEHAKEVFAHICSWDLHSGNLMWDPHHERCVITDPLSFLRTGRDEALEYARNLRTGESTTMHEVAA